LICRSTNNNFIQRTSLECKKYISFQNRCHSIRFKILFSSTYILCVCTSLYRNKNLFFLFSLSLWSLSSLLTITDSQLIRTGICFYLLEKTQWKLKHVESSMISIRRLKYIKRWPLLRIQIAASLSSYLFFLYSVFIYLQKKEKWWISFYEFWVDLKD